MASLSRYSFCVGMLIVSMCQAADKKMALSTKMTDKQVIHKIQSYPFKNPNIAEIIALVERYPCLRAPRINGLYSVMELAVVAEHKHPGSIARLKALGVSTNQENCNGQTSLMRLAGYRDISSRSLLEHKEVDVTLCDAKGSDALMRALVTPDSLHVAKRILARPEMATCINRKVKTSCNASHIDWAMVPSVESTYVREALRRRADAQYGEDLSAQEKENRDRWYRYIISKMVDLGAHIDVSVLKYAASTDELMSDVTCFNTRLIVPYSSMQTLSDALKDPYFQSAEWTEARDLMRHHLHEKQLTLCRSVRSVQ